jgi:hypothetical protein
MMVLLSVCDQAFLDTPFDGNTTPLEVAVDMQLSWLLLALVESGVDVFKVYANNLSIMHRVLNDYAVKTLVKAGANVNYQTCDTGATPLMYAATRNIQVVQALIDARADVNLRDNHGNKATKYACNDDVFTLINTEIQKVHTGINKLKIAATAASKRAQAAAKAAADAKAELAGLQKRISASQASVDDLEGRSAQAARDAAHATAVYEAARTGKPAPPPLPSAPPPAAPRGVRKACEAMARDGECRVANCRLQHEPCERHMSKFGSCTVAHCTGVHPHAEVYRRFVTCSICMDRCGGMTTQLPCKHIFDHDCLSSWLRTERSCPNCRAPVNLPTRR